MIRGNADIVVGTQKVVRAKRERTEVSWTEEEKARDNSTEAARDRREKEALAGIGEQVRSRSRKKREK